MKCKICSVNNKVCFTGQILGKYYIKYYHCSNCDFIQTEEPFWLEEAYSRSINLSDTGYMVRNLKYSKYCSVFLYFLFGKSGRYLDYAGGYGVFVRIMRDIGFNFYWDDKYTKNIFSSGFEWDQSSKIDAVTLFEVFEHFVDPVEEISKLLEISNIVIFSTELHPTPILEPKEWWYYGLDHGQHISFYSEKTFRYISGQLGLNYINVGSLHVLSREKIPSWKINAPKLNKFGMHNIINKIMDSKTWSDYKYITKVDE